MAAWRLMGVCLALAPGLGRAGEVHCAARLVNSRVVVDATVEKLVPPEVSRLMKFGLAGRIEVEASVWRINPMWFDSLLASTSRTLRCEFDPAAREWKVGSRTVERVETLSLPRLVLGATNVVPGERLGVRVKVSIQVVTAASLRQTAEWMAGQETPIPEAILQALAETLRVAVEGGCQVVFGSPDRPRDERP